MSYTVFARKYRPQTFDEVVGQEHIVRTLKNAIEQQRLAQAYLFVGPRGTGKTSTARIFAKALNCINAPTTHPCGVCDMCKEIAAGNSMNVMEFDAASNTQVDKIRELIIDTVKYAPTRGAYKIYIVDEVHMLSTNSFNALLKTLEEPPAHVKFVFATTDVQKVPTTIISRCQRFDLRRIAAPEIAAHLQFIAGREGIALAPLAADAIARGAEGGMRDAESMLDQLVAFCGERIDEAQVLSVFGLTSAHTTTALVDHLLSNDAAAALAILHQLDDAGKDLSRLLSDLIAHLRNLLILQCDPAGLQGEVTAEALAELSTQSGRAPREKLLELIDLFAAAETQMKHALNKKLHLEVAVIRAVQALQQTTLSDVLDTLTALRDGAPLPPAQPPQPPPVKPRPAAPAETPRRAEQPTQVAEPPAARPAEPEATSKFAAMKATLGDDKTSARTPAASVDRRGSKTSAAAPQVAEPKQSIPLREEPQGPAAAAPAPSAPPKGKAQVTEPAAPASDQPAPAGPTAAEVWPLFVGRVRVARPLAASWVEKGEIVEIANGVATFAFPKDAGLALESCEKPSNRQFFQSILAELAGHPLELRFEERAGWTPEQTVPPAPPAAPPPDPAASFRDDPLIQKALHDFHAEIVTA